MTNKLSENFYFHISSVLFRLKLLFSSVLIETCKWEYFSKKLKKSWFKLSYIIISYRKIIQQQTWAHSELWNYLNLSLLLSQLWVLFFPKMFFTSCNRWRDVGIYLSSKILKIYITETSENHWRICLVTRSTMNLEDRDLFFVSTSWNLLPTGSLYDYSSYEIITVFELRTILHSV